MFFKAFSYVSLWTLVTIASKMYLSEAVEKPEFNANSIGKFSTTPKGMPYRLATN